MRGMAVPVLAFLLGCYESGNQDYVGDPAVAFESASYVATEASKSGTLTLVRTGSSVGQIRVTVVDDGGSAEAGKDYEYSPRTVTWDDGETSPKSIEISIVHDTLAEGDEQISLSLQNLSAGAVYGSPRRAVLTIRDSNAPPAGAFQFSAAQYDANEDAGRATVTVTRTGGSAGAAAVTVEDAASGTATSGSDYTFSSTVLRWADGDASPKTADVTITDDTTSENAETVALRLSVTEGGGAAGTQSTTTVAIHDNDAVAGRVQFAEAAYSANENSGRITISVARLEGGSGAISVRYSTRDGSAGATDYTPSTGLLEWADGDTGLKSFDVPLVDDGLGEGNETFEVLLSEATGGATLGSPSSSTVTILDDEPAGGTLEFTASAYRAGEGDGTARIVARRNGSGSGTVSVTYATRGGSAGTGDYVVATGTLVWQDGDTSDKFFDVTIVDDAEIDPDETVGLVLENPSGAQLGSIASATLTITDNEAAGGSLEFSSGDFRAGEGDGTARITVRRTGGTGRVTVGYSTRDGSANSGDYQPASGTLVWEDGDTTDKTFDVSLTDDSEVESDETVGLVLENATGGQIGGVATATLTISDNEPQGGTLEFTAADFRAGEADGTVRITVRRTGGTGRVTVGYATRDGSAGSGDYQAASGTLVWEDGDTTDKFFDVTIVDDAEDESDETVSLILENPTDASLGSVSSATITILDNEP